MSDNKYNNIIAEGCIDAVELIQAHKLSEFTDVITNIIDAKLGQLGEDYELSEDELNEFSRTIKTKVDAKGKRRRKLACGPGFKLDPTTNSCKPISGVEKQHRKVGHKMASKTKKRQGAGYLLKVKKKTSKARAHRQHQGLK